MHAHEIVKRGISQSPEGRKLFPRMTVVENLEMGAFQRSDRAAVSVRYFALTSFIRRAASAQSKLRTSGRVSRRFLQCGENRHQV